MNTYQNDNFIKYKPDNSLNKIKKENCLISFVKNILNIFINIKKFFSLYIKRINTFISKFSIITQMVIILIPFSIFCLMLILFLHIRFYEGLYYFNFSKGLKEDFLDDYIESMDDLKSDIDAFITRENYLGFENQIFLEVYYKELASIGILDNPNKKIIPNISDHSETLYLLFNDYANTINSGDIYTIPKERAKEYIDDREGDSLGELAKIFYYMIPIIGTESFLTNIVINKTFFIGYEFDENKRIKNQELYFLSPRNKYSFSENDNFSPKGDLLNPVVSKEKYEGVELTNNNYYSDNWFTKQDYKFRELIDLSKKEYSQISLAHLNYEHDGNIKKSLIITSQQYINRNNRYYIINIIFFLQKGNIREKTNEYSSFIIKSNPNFPDNKNENQKYSDNNRYVILKSDATEYSLTSVDYQYFHFGLYEKNHSFIKNGISFDSFNLDYLYNPFEYYSSVDDYDFDLKYFTTLYLYKMLFQSINYTIIKKRREEIYLYHFNDENKINHICREINFKDYKDFMEKSDINCWSTENKLFYDEVKFENTSMINISSKYPYCSCLPLFCLENYENFDDDYNKINFASKINLPSKCENKFKSYISKNNLSNNSSVNDNFFSYLGSQLDISRANYIKLQLEKIYHLPGYYLFIITQITSNTNFYIYYYYNLTSKYYIIFFVIICLFVNSALIIIIMYINLRRYVLVIKEFKEKYDSYLLESNENAKIDNMLQKHSKNKNINNKGDKNMPILQNDKNISNANDNTLLDELFSIFCKYYKISRKDIDNYYSTQKHETKIQMNLKMMMQKNELFRLLSMFSIYAPSFKLNISLDYKMYKYSEAIKKYDSYVSQVLNIDKEQTRLTQNILYELLSTEKITDYGLIINLNFNYITNIKAEYKENSIQNAMFINIINQIKGKDEDKISINDMFTILKNGDEQDNIKLIQKQDNELIEAFKDKFESDDYINIYNLENSFDFFLVNTYYKYLKQIVL